MVAYKQDMPPGEGFNPIDWAKRPARNRISGIAQLGLFVAFTGVGWVWYASKRKHWRETNIELRDSRFASEPFLVAERQRAYLTHLRRNRDEENELMKDVEGWETGTLWGEPVYYNLRDRFKKPIMEELITHMDKWDKSDYMWDRLWR